jgi:hypothetical protein
MLRRSILSTLLWEDTFYEDGVSISERIANLILEVGQSKVLDLAIEARDKFHLRHVPLFILREAARYGWKISGPLTHVIQRPDEITEFFAMYRGSLKEPLTRQAKKGLAEAFKKFNEYQLAKYNSGKREVTLKKVMFMVHPKPKDKTQEILWKKLIEDNLAIPDTWETKLSAGQDKRQTFETLIAERKLGGLALIRNLRNMISSGVSNNIIRKALTNMNTEKIFPLRFITAERYAPSFSTELESAMFKSLKNLEKLPGETIVLVDVSGSMEANISTKSEVSRMDAAFSLAVLAKELCENCRIFAFSDSVTEVPSRRGFGMMDKMRRIGHGGTHIGLAVEEMNKYNHDRLIVITDEQSHDRVKDPSAKRAYMLNVAPYQNGVGYGNKWVHFDGFSEHLFDFIVEYEKEF